MSNPKTTKSYDGFTEEERSAMKERAKELKAAGRKADEENALLEKLAEMPEADRVIGERIHAIVKKHAPGLQPKLWYGMPAYAKNGKIVCFFKAADKFKSRYATFGFEETALLDDGTMWPIAWALTKLAKAHEATIAELVKRAAG